MFANIANKDIVNLAWFVVIYAFMGWLLETVYASWEERRFVNRGFLSGPFCPIYGFGSLLMIVILHPLINKPYHLFIGAVLLASILEYLTGWLLEKVFDHKWWDYSNQSYNLQGRICLRYSIYWGILALFMLKLIHPGVVRLLETIPFSYRLLGLYGISFYFLADFMHTVLTVSELKAMLAEMQHLAAEGRERLEQIIESSIEGFEETSAELKAKYEILLNRLTTRNQRLLKAFPNLRNKHHHFLIITNPDGIIDTIRKAYMIYETRIKRQ